MSAEPDFRVFGIAAEEMSERDRAMLLSDIRYWYMAYQECPHCGTCLRDLAPENNLVPHFTGACIVPDAVPA